MKAIRLACPCLVLLLSAGCQKTQPAQAKQDAIVLLTMQTMNYLHAGHHRVAL